jgi:hypothetical protein
MRNEGARKKHLENDKDEAARRNTSLKILEVKKITSGVLAANNLHHQSTRLVTRPCNQ